MPTENEYSLQDLADLAGVSPRTVRYYVAQGLLPSPGQTGPGARYTDGHLARLRLIRRLQREHLPLAEIRNRLAQLDDETIAGLLEADAPAPPDSSALDYVRAVLGGQPQMSHSPADPAGPAPAASQAIFPVPVPSFLRAPGADRGGRGPLRPPGHVPATGRGSAPLDTRRAGQAAPRNDPSGTASRSRPTSNSTSAGP